MPARAIGAGALDVRAHQLRDWADNKHGKTDDRPFGGGPGMVMSPQPIWDAVQAVEAHDQRPTTRVLLTPQGRRLTQHDVERFATSPRLLMLCGHYEGLDERVIDALEPDEVSIGDYVLSGGEIAGLVLIDAIARLLPGVLGHAESAIRDSFSEPETTDAIGTELPRKALQRLGLPEGARVLDCPHYTKPVVWRGREVPDVLRSGDHQRIAEWRLAQALERTRQRRPDLLEPGR
ncbi:MAG: tRNA (guanine(37)-N(1))-methyltransferase [Planctomycetota bacterium]